MANGATMDWDKLKVFHAAAEAVAVVSEFLGTVSEAQIIVNIEPATANVLLPETCS